MLYTIQFMKNYLLELFLQYKRILCDIIIVNMMVYTIYKNFLGMNKMVRTEKQLTILLYFDFFFIGSILYEIHVCNMGKCIFAELILIATLQGLGRIRGSVCIVCIDIVRYGIIIVSFLVCYQDYFLPTIQCKFCVMKY